MPRLPRPRAGWLSTLTAIAALLALPVGCSGPAQGVVLIAGEKVDAAEIDRDPLALLPEGIVMLGYLDAQTMFATELGADVAKIIQNVLPIGPESNFSPARDVSRIYGGVYAMQGVDFCAVVQGNFDRAAIQRSADARTEVAPGVPIVKTRYADYDLYTAGNLGFVVLTDHTVLSGNETGMRRALDRMRFSKLGRSIPGWMIELTETKGAAFAFAGDLGTQAAVQAATQTIPFVNGLKKVRVIGNFQSPGLNFVGSLTYSDAATAQAGATTLSDLSKLTQFMSLLSSWGMGNAAPPMQVALNGSDVSFTMPLDAGMVRTLMRLTADATTPAKLFGASP